MHYVYGAVSFCNLIGQDAFQLFNYMHQSHVLIVTLTLVVGTEKRCLRKTHIQNHAKKDMLSPKSFQIASELALFCSCLT